MIVLALILIICMPVALAQQDERAKSLFLESKYNEAAQEFSDPLWRGIAYYRAGEWLNAAKSFARSDTSIARYNLANSYAQLGLFSLALESYSLVKPDSPAFANARENADLMKRLLADDNERKSSLLSQQKSEPGGKKTGNGSGKKSGSQNDEKSDSSRSGDRQRDIDESPNPSGQNKQPFQSKPEELQQSQRAAETEANRKDKQANALTQSSQQTENNPPSSTSEGLIQEIKGMDKQAQKRQALEQWLHTIEDHPARFLRARINQAVRQRARDGTLTEPGDSPW